MARLLSENVGLPRDIRWKSRTVHVRILEESGLWPLSGRPVESLTETVKAI
jgi:hypothetical protein